MSAIFGSLYNSDQNLGYSTKSNFSIRPFSHCHADPFSPSSSAATTHFPTMSTLRKKCLKSRKLVYPIEILLLMCESSENILYFVKHCWKALGTEKFVYVNQSCSGNSRTDRNKCNASRFEEFIILRL